MKNFDFLMIFMDFHEQQIKEIIDFGVSNHRKSMKKHLLRPEITPRPLGVGKQTRYLGLLASHARSSCMDLKQTYG